MQSPAPPSRLFPELLQRCGQADIGPDMKGFVDARPRASATIIMEAFRSEQPQSAAQLQAFVQRWFDLPKPIGDTDLGAQSASIAAHIEALWPALVREDPAQDDGSRIALPFRYVVPGGMFRENYYWDTFFTILGLRHSDRQLCEEAVGNLAYLIDRFGFVPNGNRTYYLTRSQPPFFFASLAALNEIKPEAAFAAYLPQLRREHAFWMSGDEQIEKGADRRVVRMPGGEILNRYWDDGDWPRDEAYREDADLARRAEDRDGAGLFRDVRAACESGWDFSSRWFADPAAMETIMTTLIVPADLNALLFGLEDAIRLGAELSGDAPTAAEFHGRSEARLKAMNRYLWNEARGFFDDYNFARQALRNSITPACLFPLFGGVATTSQALRTAMLVEERLLAPGGLVSSLNESGQQWDAPNGWAPLQWIGIEGLERYGLKRLASEIAKRWLTTVDRVFKETGRLFEKYDVIDIDAGGGGEYPLQDGFGWTNGVTADLLNRYPSFAQRLAPRR